MMPKVRSQRSNNFRMMGGTGPEDGLLPSAPPGLFLGRRIDFASGIWLNSRMKRIFALTLVCLVPLGLTRNVSAGPESLPHDGKESMKNVVEPVMEKECNWTGFKHR